MGLFGGDSSSEQFVEENITTTTTNANQTGAQAAVAGGSFNRIQVLDAGAVRGSLALADNSLTKSLAFSGKSLEFAEKSVDGAFALSSGIVQDLIASHDRSVGNAIQFAENSSKSSNEFAATVANPNQEAQKDIIKNLAIGLGIFGVGLAFVVMGKK